MHFSAQKHVYTARWSFLHELARLSLPKEYVSQKFSVFLIAIGQFSQVFCVKPTETQKELGNMFMAQEFSFFVFDMKAVTAHMGNREESDSPPSSPLHLALLC